MYTVACLCMVEAKVLILLQSLLLLLLVFCFTACSSLDTISLNHPIRDGGGDLIISKGNKFALGFFSPADSSARRYLGIWFHNISDQTVVWVANRNNPINDSSGTLSIDHQGRNLLLSYSHLGQQVPVWSTNDVTVEEAARGNNTTTTNTSCVAQLLDTGNLVLLLRHDHDDDGRRSGEHLIIWQSFDYPTDTMLPGMKLGLDLKTGLNKFLTSRRSSTDPAIGDYSYMLKHGASPQFCLSKGSKVIWRSAPWPWIMNSEETPTYSYRYDFVYNEDEIQFHCGFFQGGITARMVLSEYGSFQLFSWHDHKWVEFWSAPKDTCDRYRTCGAYGVCDPTYSNRQFCSCLPGYEPKSPNNWYLRDGSDGCVKKRASTSMCSTTRDGFMKMERIKLPDTRTAAAMNTSSSPKECRQTCLSNCSCAAFASLNINGSGTGCLLWYGELLDSVHQTTDCYDLYVRVDAIELAEDTKKSNTFVQNKGMLAILVVSLAAIWCSITVAYVLWRNRRKRRGRSKWNYSLFDDVKKSNYYNDTSGSTEIEERKRHPDLVLFNLRTLVVATNSFSPRNKLGEGGFGSVYMGKLTSGKEVAVKRLSQSSRQGVEEFKNEVLLIAKLQHRNLVKLLGCCIEGEEPMLIYEYLPNKSLDSFLRDKSRRSALDWRKRFNIIVGIARGILYLHQDSRLRIIHRDIKTSNILLDEDMNPKISDFGTARMFKDDEHQSKTKRIIGTYGYMSPEYATFGRFSVKSDVFSFGVVLLEIVSGKKNSDFFLEDPALNLIGHVWELWRAGRTMEIVDASMDAEEAESYRCREAMIRCIQIGLLCVQEKAADRPTMLEVGLMLNSEIPLPTPKQPAFVSGMSCSSSDLSTEQQQEEEEDQQKTWSINGLTVSSFQTQIVD